MKAKVREVALGDFPWAKMMTEQFLLEFEAEIRSQKNIKMVCGHGWRMQWHWVIKGKRRMGKKTESCVWVEWAWMPCDFMIFDTGGGGPVSYKFDDCPLINKYFYDS